MAKSIEELSPVAMRINLRSEFPRPLRAILRRAMAPLLIFVFALVAIWTLDRFVRAALPEGGLILDSFQMICMLIVALLTLFVAARVLYEIIHFMTYHYMVELEHLVITKGLFYRARASVPLAQITDVSLSRGPIDLMFNLYDVRIMTASPSAELTKIDCLSPRRAIGLQERLLSLIETALPNIDERAAERRVPPPPEQPPVQQIA